MPTLPSVIRGTHSFPRNPATVLRAHAEAAAGRLGLNGMAGYPRSTPFTFGDAKGKHPGTQFEFSYGILKYSNGGVLLEANLRSTGAKAGPKTPFRKDLMATGVTVPTEVVKKLLGTGTGANSFLGFEGKGQVGTYYFKSYATGKIEGLGFPDTATNNANPGPMYFPGPAPVVALVKSHDTTPARLIAAHLAAYGPGNISYQDAFARAVNAVITSEEPNSPRAQLRDHNFGGENTGAAKKSLDQAMMQQLTDGGLKLQGVGESNIAHFTDPTFPKKNWLFLVDINQTLGMDYEYWVSVNRETGKASVTGDQ